MTSGLPEPVAQLLLVVLDLTYGAGARGRDLRAIRGTDIDCLDYAGRRYAVVTLSNSAGGHRQVPVVDSAISARLLTLASERGDKLMLRPNSLVGERNLANRINEYLKKRGYPAISIRGLRSAWVLQVAETVPAAQLIQLADVLDVRLVAETRHLREDFTVPDMIAALTREDIR